jgi:glycosyltransferase involved in cell wall biosynthesis
MKVLIVIPAYNEETNILSVVQKVINAGYDYVVINDGSDDSTSQILDSNHINHIDLLANLGIGGAVQTGHLYALQNGYDIDIQFDGDGQHDISYVPALIAAIKRGADLVIGSRFIGSCKGFQSTKMRRIGIRWLDHCIYQMTGLSIKDVTSGFRASGRRAIELFAYNYPVDYPEPESIVVAYKKKLLIQEVPVTMHERQGGTSSIRLFSSIYYMIKVTLAILIEGYGSKRNEKQS